MAVVDFSQYSKILLRRADKISMSADAQLVIVNVISQKELKTVRKEADVRLPNDFLLSRYLPAKMGRRKLKLQALINGLGLSEGPARRLIISYGDPYEEIRHIINREKIDLVVIRSKAGPKIFRYLFPSFTEKVFRYSQVPVMRMRI